MKFADGPPASLPPADADEPNDVPMDAQVLATASGSTDAIADFGDDRRDVYKVYVRAGETLTTRTEALPFGGNLGLDIAIYPPGSKNIASSLKGSLDHTRSASAVSLLHARNTTGKGGYFLVQASSRRGWGAYRLRWSVTPSRT